MVATVLKLISLCIVSVNLADLCQCAERGRNENAAKMSKSSSKHSQKQKTPFIMKGRHYAVQGIEHMRANDYRKALKLCNQAIGKNSQRWSYFGLRGLCLMETGKVEDGIKDFRTAVSLARDKSEENNTKPCLLSGAQLLTMGRALCDQKMYEEAFWCFDEASKTEMVDSRRHMAECYLKFGALDAAITRLRSVIEVEPTSMADRRRLCQVLIQYGDFDGALEEISHVDATGDELIELGNKLKYDHGNPEPALKFYAKAIEKSSENAEFYQKRGRCHLDLGNYDKAVLDLENALDYDPQIDSGHNFLAEALFYCGRRDEAIQESSYMDYSALLVLGNKFLNNKRYQYALDCFNEALEQYSNSEFAFASRAFCHRALGNLESAISDIRASLRLQPDNPSIRVDLLELLLETNANKKAEEETEYIKTHHDQYRLTSSQLERLVKARQELQKRRGTPEVDHSTESESIIVPANPFDDSPKLEIAPTNPFDDSPKLEIVPKNPFGDSPKLEIVPKNPFGDSPEDKII